MAENISKFTKANAIVGNNEMFRQNGFDDYISKPINLHQLNNCLNTYIRDRHPEEAKKYKPESVDFKPSVNRQDDSVTIKGVNTSKGIMMTGGKLEKYINVLNVLCKDAQDRLLLLKDVPNNETLPVFITQVHSLKSALATIGADELSAKSAALEAAGKERDIVFIESNLSIFAEQLSELIGRVENFLQEKKESAQPQGEAAGADAVKEDTAFLKEHLEILCTACDNYDDSGAYKALNKLKEKQWKAETVSALEEIHSQIYFNSDFEKAKERTLNLLNA